MVPPDTATLVTATDDAEAAELVSVTVPVPVMLPVGKVMVSGFGVIDTVPRVATLVPVRFTGVGVTVAPVYATVRVRLWAPVVAGAANTTRMVQLAPTARVAPQVPPAAPPG